MSQQKMSKQKTKKNHFFIEQETEEQVRGRATLIPAVSRDNLIERLEKMKEQRGQRRLQEQRNTTQHKLDLTLFDLPAGLPDDPAVDELVYQMWRNHEDFQESNALLLREREDMRKEIEELKQKAIATEKLFKDTTAKQKSRTDGLGAEHAKQWSNLNDYFSATFLRMAAIKERCQLSSCKSWDDFTLEKDGQKWILRDRKKGKKTQDSQLHQQRKQSGTEMAKEKRDAPEGKNTKRRRVLAPASAAEGFGPTGEQQGQISHASTTSAFIRQQAQMRQASSPDQAGPMAVEERGTSHRENRDSTVVFGSFNEAQLVIATKQPQNNTSQVNAHSMQQMKPTDNLMGPEAGVKVERQADGSSVYKFGNGKVCHIKYNPGKKSYDCLACKASLSRRQGAKRHLENGCYRCEVCGKKYSRRDDVFKHMRASSCGK